MQVHGPGQVTLAEIATEALPLLDRLKDKPLDAPVETVVELMKLQDQLTKAGKDELANKLIVIILAVAPVDDHDRRPEKMDVFATYMIGELLKDLKALLE